MYIIILRYKDIIIIEKIKFIYCNINLKKTGNVFGEISKGYL